MGCLSLQFRKACNARSPKIKVLTVEGRCLKYVAPVVVKDVLMDYPLHALFDAEAVHDLGNRARPLHGTLLLKPGRRYLLIPLPSHQITRTSSPPSLPSEMAEKCSRRTRKVSFAEAPLETLVSTKSSTESRPLRERSMQILPSPCDGVIRLKMVVSKRQLASVLKDDGGDSVSMIEGLLSPLLQASGSDTQGALLSSCNEFSSSRSWRPSLESIPESTQ